tara:strand:+ start:183 stop:890 length:708 start_codon:yes stop_codon:yes gene_type:complete
MLGNHSLLIPLSLGIIPALIWLFFWLREDKKRPEPRGLIMATFIVGMCIVPVVIPFQKIGFDYFGQTAIAFLIVSVSEEICKFLAAYITALRSKDNDEPLDPTIYMITAALGFSAVENTLFLFKEITTTNAFFSSLLITGNLRFIGATLLHIISSATIGIFMSLSFYKSQRIKNVSLFIGIILSITLHTVFNLLIINSVTTNIFVTFSFVWIGVIILLLFFEKVKTIRPFRKIKK